MDTLSHALWGYGLFGFKRLGVLAFLMGAMPDLPSFGLYMVMGIVEGTIERGPPSLTSLPDWVFFNYDFMHSFVVSWTCILLVFLWNRKVAFAMLGWPFHIVLDFPFHSKAYFPTKIFWPISDVVVDGIPWSRPVVYLPNLAGLMILFYWRSRQHTRVSH